MKVKIRRAKISDIPQLEDLLFEFYRIQRNLGVKTIVENDNVLKGGVAIELGSGFMSPNWMCIIAERAGDIIAVMIGVVEFCTPTASALKCVKITTNYLVDNSLAGPRVLIGIWGLMKDWATENGAEFFYSNIHPGNQPSIRAAKHVGFKHHFTQFYKPNTEVEE